MPSRLTATQRRRCRCRRAAHWLDVRYFAQNPEARHNFRDPVLQEFRKPRSGRLAKEYVYNVLAIRVGIGVFTTLVTLRRDHLEIDRAAALEAALDELEKNGVAQGHKIARRQIDAQPNNPATGDVEHVYPIATRYARR